jgi:hypothetical protein
MGGRCGRCQGELTLVEEISDHTEVLGTEVDGIGRAPETPDDDHTMGLDDLSGD